MPDVRFTVSFRNDNPNTIWNRLAAKLGREPTHRETCDEVKRIMTESLVERATRGQLPHQRKRSR